MIKIDDFPNCYFHVLPFACQIFVHPMSGKGNGCRTWEAVAPIFLRAKVQTKVNIWPSFLLDRSCSLIY